MHTDIRMKKILLFFPLFIASFITHAQSIPIGQPGTEDMLRVLQLTGKIDSAHSLTSRPFFYNNSITRKNLLSLIDSSFDVDLAEKSFSNNKIKFSVLPATFATKFNSHHPYGWNDGPMLMAKGLQTSLTAGVYAELGPLSIQLQPEYVYSTNATYAITTDYGYNSEKSYSKLFLGQSAIRLKLGAVSIAASSESLWWGPGQFSSILMSNNAPGFQHLSFNTIKPLKTPIGSFEWQLVVGRLDEDTAAAFENNNMKPFYPKNEPRYFNGMVITYQPSFIKGFFLGLTRSVHLYMNGLDQSSGSFISKYLPVLAGASPDANASANSIPSDGAFSVFTRWIMPKQKAEFYLEYGYNDFKQNLRDLAVNANHSSAYIAGFKKLIELPKNELLDISGEITQMSQTTSYVLRNSWNFYSHVGVDQGYTYQNQIMGAGSGKGNNVQTLQIKKIQGFQYVGIKLQRIKQNPKDVNPPLLNSLGMRDIQWTDVAIGFLGQKRWNRFVVNGELQLVSSKNYGFAAGNKFNLFAVVNATYYW